MLLPRGYARQTASLTCAQASLCSRCPAHWQTSSELSKLSCFPFRRSMFLRSLFSGRIGPFQKQIQRTGCISGLCQLCSVQVSVMVCEASRRLWASWCFVSDLAPSCLRCLGWMIKKPKAVEHLKKYWEMEGLAWWVSLYYSVMWRVVSATVLGQQATGGKQDFLLVTTKILIFQILITPSDFSYLS